MVKTEAKKFYRKKSYRISWGKWTKEATKGGVLLTTLYKVESYTNFRNLYIDFWSPTNLLLPALQEWRSRSNPGIYSNLICYLDLPESCWTGNSDRPMNYCHNCAYEIINNLNVINLFCFTSFAHSLNKTV